MLKQIWVCRRAVNIFSCGKWFARKAAAKTSHCKPCHHTACKGPVKGVLEVKP